MQSAIQSIDPGRHTFIIRDDEGKLQAACSWSTNGHTYVSWLGSTSHVHGAGSELLREVARESHGKAIDLTPLSDAIPFYQKVGFQYTGGGMHMDPTTVDRYATMQWGQYAGGARAETRPSPVLTQTRSAPTPSSAGAPGMPTRSAAVARLNTEIGRVRGNVRTGAMEAAGIEMVTGQNGRYLRTAGGYYRWRDLATGREITLEEAGRRLQVHDGGQPVIANAAGYVRSPSGRGYSRPRNGMQSPAGFHPATTFTPAPMQTPAAPAAAPDEPVRVQPRSTGLGQHAWLSPSDPVRIVEPTPRGTNASRALGREFDFLHDYSTHEVVGDLAADERIQIAHNGRMVDTTSNLKKAGLDFVRRPDGNIAFNEDGMSRMRDLKTGNELTREEAGRRLLDSKQLRARSRQTADTVAAKTVAKAHGPSTDPDDTDSMWTIYASDNFGDSDAHLIARFEGLVPPDQWPVDVLPDPADESVEHVDDGATEAEKAGVVTKNTLNMQVSGGRQRLTVSRAHVSVSRSRVHGGEGSGNYGHAGRPGEVGGSAPEGEGGGGGEPPAKKSRDMTTPRQVGPTTRGKGGVTTHPMYMPDTGEVRHVTVPPNEEEEGPFGSQPGDVGHVKILKDNFHHGTPANPVYFVTTVDPQGHEGVYMPAASKADAEVVAKETAKHYGVEIKREDADPGNRRLRKTPSTMPKLSAAGTSVTREAFYGHSKDSGGVDKGGNFTLRDAGGKEIGHASASFVHQPETWPLSGPVPGKTAIIDSIEIDDKRQGKGLGTHLLSEVEGHAKAAGMERMWSVSTMSDAEGFWAKRGYQNTGHKRIWFKELMPGAGSGFTEPKETPSQPASRTRPDLTKVRGMRRR
jgi:GNAT superfamily N-acetyltransferase